MVSISDINVRSIKSFFLDVTLNKNVNQVVICTSMIALGSFILYESHQVLKKKQDLQVRPTFSPEENEFNQRLIRVYKWMLGAVSLTVLTVAVAYRCLLAKTVSRHPLSLIPLSLIHIAALTSIQKLDHETSASLQKLAWLISTISMGVILSPIVLISPLLIFEAALIASLVGISLTVMAYTFSEETCMSWKRPILTALTFCSIVGTCSHFSPKLNKLYGLNKLSMYIGFGIILGTFLYHTQKVRKTLKESTNQFDPIKQSIIIYIDITRLFVKIIELLEDPFDN